MNKKSFFIALGCYVLWGILPLYWDMLSDVNAVFILGNRITFACVFALILIACTGQFGNYLAVLKNKQLMKYLIPAALVETVNWGVYIWAAVSGHMLDASLGYYLNPLVVCLFSVLMFKEKMTIAEWIAIGLAAVGVVLSTVQLGQFPYIAVIIGVSFALYGSLKKKASVDPVISIGVETTILFPFSLTAVLIMGFSGEFLALDAGRALLLVGAGVVTAVPIMLYSKGVNDLPFITMGFLQFITPTLFFVYGILAGEQLDTSKLISFCFIWAGLAVYLIDLIRRGAQTKHAHKAVSASA